MTTPAVIWWLATSIGMAATGPSGAAGEAGGGKSAQADPGGSSACVPAQPQSGPGVVDPFHVPAATATQLNADGKLLYRQGRWEEARAKYRAAETADPDFLAPALNVACSFVRQERFDDAVTEVLRLLDRAYLPWSAEIASAADLGALKVRVEGKSVRAALESGRMRWAEGLVDDVILVARVRAPLKLGRPSGTEETLVLGPRQEIFAWSPRTRRYRQVTSEEGRVLAVARSPDKRRIVYVTAEKLLRGPGATLALRGVVVKELELATLTPVGRAAIAGDVRSLGILTTGTEFDFRIDQGSGDKTYKLAGAQLEPVSVARVARAARATVTLTGRGVVVRVPASPLPGACPGTVRDVLADGSGPAIEVGVPVGQRVTRPLRIGGPFGAGLSGLPLP